MGPYTVAGSQVFVPHNRLGFVGVGTNVCALNSVDERGVGMCCFAPLLAESSQVRPWLAVGNLGYPLFTWHTRSHGD